MVRFVLLIVLLMAPPAAASVDGAAVRTRAAVLQVMQENPVPAISIAVAVEGEQVYAEAFGFSSLSDSIFALPETRFGIGSITKSLTLALVQHFVDRDILDWDLPLETWLEDFPYRGDGMTLRHIGAHQSGIDDSFSNSLRFTDEHYTTDRAYREITSAPLEFEPGSRTQYGTAGFTVIAEIIERVTGDPFEEVLRREILDPSGMTQTSALDPCVEVDDLTVFYDSRGDELVAVVVDPSYKRAGAGYVCSAADLVRFGVTLNDGKLCTTEELFRLQTADDGSASNFGLGWRVTDDAGRRVVFQAGGGPGISGYLVIYPDLDLVIAILSNETAAPVGGQIMEECTGAFLELVD